MLIGTGGPDDYTNFEKHYPRKCRILLFPFSTNIRRGSYECVTYDILQFLVMFPDPTSSNHVIHTDLTRILGQRVAFCVADICTVTK